MGSFWGVANGMSWTFDGNGIVQTADIVLIAGSKDDDLGLRDSDTPDCWLPLPSGYDSNKVPTAPEYVRFMFERIPSEGGIKLGLRVNSELSNNLPPVGQQDVYTGLKLGLGGTALGDVIQYAYAGVALGLDVSSESGVANAIYTGLKVGLNVEPSFDLVPKEVEIGVALGLNVGPSIVPNAVLLHFDNGIAFEDPGFPQTTAIDSSPSAHVFTTHGTNSAIYTNDEIQSARFGPSYMFSSIMKMTTLQMVELVHLLASLHLIQQQIGLLKVGFILTVSLSLMDHHQLMSNFL